MFVQTPFLGSQFYHLFVFVFQRMVDLGTPSTSSGRQNGTEFNQTAPKWIPGNSLAFIILYLEKYKCMQKRRVDWTFVFMFFAFSNLGGTTIKTYMICSFILVAPNIHRETPNGLAIRDPMAAKRETQQNQEGRSAWRFSMYLASPVAV